MSFVDAHGRSCQSSPKAAMANTRATIVMANTSFSSLIFVIGLVALTLHLVQVSPTAANLKLGSVKATTREQRDSRLVSGTRGE
jgi:hypothetical protein